MQIAAGTPGHRSAHGFGALLSVCDLPCDGICPSLAKLTMENAPPHFVPRVFKLQLKITAQVA